MGVEYTEPPNDPGATNDVPHGIRQPRLIPAQDKPSFIVTRVPGDSPLHGGTERQLVGRKQAGWSHQECFSAQNGMNPTDHSHRRLSTGLALAADQVSRTTARPATISASNNATATVAVPMFVW